MNSTSNRSLMLLMLAIASLTGCQTATLTGGTRAVCAVFPPITYSSRDTPETVVQVRKHNAGRDSYCGRK